MDNYISDPRIRTFDEASPEDEESDRFIESNRSLLNPYSIPRIPTDEYQQYITQDQPANVKFQVRISKETRPQTVMVSRSWRQLALVDRLQRFLRTTLCGGILSAFNTPLGSLIIGFTMLVKKEGRLTTRIPFESSAEGWDSAVQNLKNHGIGRNVDHSVSSVDTVLLLVRLRLKLWMAENTVTVR